MSVLVVAMIVLAVVVVVLAARVPRDAALGVLVLMGADVPMVMAAVAVAMAAVVRRDQFLD